MMMICLVVGLEGFEFKVEEKTGGLEFEVRVRNGNSGEPFLLKDFTISPYSDTNYFQLNTFKKFHSQKLDCYFYQNKSC